MNYTVHTDDYSIVNGTCLQGYLHCSYKQLTKAFGEPGLSDGYKTDAEWIVRFDDGTVASIYNWKNGKNYCGPEGLNTEDITEWNIGGHSARSEALVRFVVLGGWNAV